MDNRIKDILDFIENNLSHSFMLEDLAARACLSASQFHRVFKKETGSTPFKFMEELKMNKAYQSIIHKDHSVHDLTEMLGYNDYETFSRAFKKHFHFSPDDLKSITQKIKESLTSDLEGDFLIAAFDGVDNDEELANQIQQTIQEKNISLEDLKDAQFFKIAPKSNLQKVSKQLVKNKFEITSGKKIWESLIQKK